eukprot:CAMPEP_0205799354 /NCGR_PEP_ID=MMETSP0205-20121125/588_1 /ASSEMBLY_ACC=CAM_ASM_000278 /TAXON_ID=36767 /ORGANISM="Euplotes focardii, Strain TN1" /LENGTH=32 /DNA_ID= /DNA_START= /DNA_END= /DNA_ORIENTATION=
MVTLNMAIWNIVFIDMDLNPMVQSTEKIEINE